MNNIFYIRKVENGIIFLTPLDLDIPLNKGKKRCCRITDKNNKAIVIIVMVINSFITIIDLNPPPKVAV